MRSTEGRVARELDDFGDSVTSLRKQLFDNMLSVCNTLFESVTAPFLKILVAFSFDFCAKLLALLPKTLGTFEQNLRHFYRKPLTLFANTLNMWRPKL